MPRPSIVHHPYAHPFPAAWLQLAPYRPHLAPYQAHLATSPPRSCGQAVSPRLIGRRKHGVYLNTVAAQQHLVIRYVGRAEHCRHVGPNGRGHIAPHMLSGPRALKPTV